jgi:rhodanese-related sulfurtransferase
MPANRLQQIIFVCTALAWFLGPGCGPPAWAEGSPEDAARRAKVEAMYSDYKKEFPGVKDIDPAAARRLFEEGTAVFIDIRAQKEQAVSMLPGAITEAEFLKDPEAFAGRTLIGYCTISYRSGKLAEKLAAKGIVLLNLRGGMLAWVHAGGKIYDRNGHETRRIHVYGRKWNLAPEDYEAVW